MLLSEFKAQMRANRGKLTKEDSNLEAIYQFGIPDLVEFALTKKLMGVANIAQIASLNTTKQAVFCKWMATMNWKATKDEIELKYRGL